MNADDESRRRSSPFSSSSFSTSLHEGEDINQLNGGGGDEEGKMNDNNVVRAAGFIIFREQPFSGSSGGSGSGDGGAGNGGVGGDDEEKKRTTTMATTERQYLLMHSRTSKNWAPPKGRMDEGEKSLLETARREVEEESGLTPSDYEATTAFERRLHYVAHNKPKEAVYWLAKLKSPFKEVQISEEHTEYRWVQIEEAKKLAARPTMQQLFEDAEKFIVSSSPSDFFSLSK